MKIELLEVDCGKVSKEVEEGIVFWDEDINTFYIQGADAVISINLERAGNA